MQLDCPSSAGYQRVKIAHMAAFAAFVRVSQSTAMAP